VRKRQKKEENKLLNVMGRKNDFARGNSIKGREKGKKLISRQQRKIDRRKIISGSG
jgi:hypothetical protein